MAWIRGFSSPWAADVSAMVSRAAFYRNYRDKYELVEQIFDEAMAEMTADDEGDTRSPGQRFAGFFGHIDAYHRLYAALLGRRIGVNFALIFFFGSFMFVLTLLLQLGLGQSPLRAGLETGPLAATFTLMAILGPRVSARASRPGSGHAP